MSPEPQPDPGARRAPAAHALSALAPGVFVVIWASGFIAARAVAPHAEPVAFTALRFGLVAPILVGMALAARAAWPATGRGWRDPLVAGALMQGAYITGVFWGVSRGVPAGVAALIGSLQPLLTAALAGPLLGERVGRRRWLGIGLGFAGALMVLAPKVGAVQGAIPPAALAACFGAMAALTLGTLWQKRTGAATDLLAGAAIQFVGACLVVGLACWLAGESRVDLSAPAVWAALGWSVLVTSVAGILLLLALIRRGAVAGVTSLFFLTPPVSALMAYGLFHETLAPVQLAGMAVAALGVAVASRG